LNWRDGRDKADGPFLQRCKSALIKRREGCVSFSRLDKRVQTVDMAACAKNMDSPNWSGRVYGCISDNRTEISSSLPVWHSSSSSETLWYYKHRMRFQIHGSFIDKF